MNVQGDDGGLPDVHPRQSCTQEGGQGQGQGEGQGLGEGEGREGGLEEGIERKETKCQ